MYVLQILLLKQTDHVSVYDFVILFVFRPGNGSSSTTNVVLCLDVVHSPKAFSFHNRSSSIADNILQNRTVSDFQVKTELINNN